MFWTACLTTVQVQFLEKLIENVLFPNSGLLSAFSILDPQKLPSGLLSVFSILDSQKLPSSDGDLSTYGCCKLETLCIHYGY